MTLDIKELVKRLRDGWSGSLRHAAADALEAMAGEVERLNAECCRCGQPTTALCKAAQAAEAERDRMKAALKLIAIVDQGCGGNLTPLEMVQSAMQQARKALGGDAS